MKVAKNYEQYEQLCEPYQAHGKFYTKLNINGTPTEVRLYNDNEYLAMYPPNDNDPKQSLGFADGDIILIFGATAPIKTWLNSIQARYHKIFGWYLPSTITPPDQYPEGIKTATLSWDEISINNHLKSELDLTEIINEKCYGASDSEFIGTKGQRLLLTLTVQSVNEFTGRFGKSFFHRMTDAENNVYTWTTNTKALKEHGHYQLIATIKDHINYHGEKQTVLVRCVITQEELPNET